MSTHSAAAVSGRLPQSARRVPNFRDFAVPAVLFLAAVAVYAPLIGWGVPHATAPDRTKTVATDEILPLEGLAEMHNTFVVSKPDRNYGYPWFHYFETAVVQAPYLVWARLSGEWDAPAPEFPFGFRDPVKALRWLTWIGRLLSVLMAAGVVVAAFLFARNLWGHSAGVVAAVLTLLSYPMVYYSRTGNPDMPAAFWTSMGLVVYSMILRDGLTPGRGVWLGVFTGIAIATKEQAVLIFLPLGASLLFSRQRSWRPHLAALAASMVAYMAAAGMLFDPHRHIEHVYRLLFQPKLTNSMWFYRPGHPKNWEGTLAMMTEFIQAMNWMHAAPVLLAAAAGAWVAARRTPRLLVLLAPMVLLYVCLVMPVRTVVLRYFLPMVPIVSGFAAYALVAMSRSKARRAAVPLIAVLCGWQLAIAVDLTYAQVRETRLSAAAWLENHARAGDRIEYFGVREAMPPLPAEIQSRRIAGRENWKKENGHGPRILQYLAAGGPEYVFIAPDVTSKPGIPFSGDCPPEVYEALLGGRTNYTQVAYFPTPALLPAWFRRPRLDYPSVAPPVRLFARNDILTRSGARP
jgi:hypothetical protein